MCQEQGIQMGLTKVFFQQKAFNSIEKLRTCVVASSVTVVQTFWRAFSCRRAYLIRRGLLQASDGSRRLRGLAACRIQRLARRYIWTATKNRRETKARAEREAQLVAQMEELRTEMQGEINSLRAELAEAKQLAKQGQSLAKRVAVVCGGASGIGPKICSRLVKEGAKIAVVDADAASAKGKVGVSMGQRGYKRIERKWISCAIWASDITCGHIFDGGKGGPVSESQTYLGLIFFVENTDNRSVTCTRSLRQRLVRGT